MSLKQQADQLLSAAVTDGAVPGVVALATNAEGTYYEGGFGERIQGDGVEMTPDTVVWLASMTKAITGAAVMQLVEQGKLELDAPASRVLPELAERQVLEGFDDAGQPVLRPAEGEIALRQLLTHTSGFVYDIWNRDFVKYLELTENPGIISCKNAALDIPLAFDPGSRWDYGIGIDWAGKMLEAASGQSLGAYFRDNLFAPLGMDSTAFRLTDEMRGRMAKVHARLGEREFELQMELEIPQEPEFEMGGGGLYSPIGDYAKFVRMILNKGAADGQQVLKSETVEMMSVNQIGDCRVPLLKSAVPESSNDAEFFPGLEKGWGLSFMILEQDAPTGRPAGSLSRAGLANSFYWIDPKNGIGGVYATQIIPFADTKSLPLAESFESLVYQNL